MVLNKSARASPGMDQSFDAKDGKDKYWNEMTEAEHDAARVLGWDGVRFYAG